MSFLHPFTKQTDAHVTQPVSYDANPLATSAPESVGTILGKVSIIWAGLFAGIKLGDVVLMATLVYTLLQIGLAVYERIIKPLQAVHEAAKIVKAAAGKESSTGQSGPQEK